MESGDHSHRPLYLDDVIDSFANHNIALHIDDGCMGGGRGNIPHTDVLESPWEETYQSQEIYFNPDRLHIFHYCVMAHRILFEGSTDRSGVGGGDSFTVAHEVVKVDRDWITATFMHELGHTLGLHHYGDVGQCPHAPDHENGAGCPDYVSIMSYYYQLHPDRWPSSWNGFPSYGSRPGWNDWDNLNFII